MVERLKIVGLISKMSILKDKKSKKRARDNSTKKFLPQSDKIDSKSLLITTI